MNYIGKEITNLVSVCKVGKDIYYNIDFVGNFKASVVTIESMKEKQDFMNDIRGKYLYIIEGKTKSEITDDTIRLVEETESRYKSLGTRAILSSPVHIKKSYKKYRWLDENGFIGPDDILILNNRNQFSLYKNCLDFLEGTSEYIKAEEYRDRVTVYKFHKYGIDGKIKKYKDGQGEIKLNIPGSENKVSFEYYVNGNTHSHKITNYKVKELTEDDRKALNELNKIIVSLGLKEIIYEK